MKKTIISALALVALLLTTSCQPEGLDGSRRGTKAILPRVSSVATTKAHPLSGPDRFVATYQLSDDPRNPLYVHIYEQDIADLPDYPQTKGTEIRTDNLTSFNMKAYAQGQWHDNEISSGQGSEAQPYNPGLYFDNVTVSLDDSKSPSEWVMGAEKFWLNDVGLSFWSWKDAEPVVSTSAPFNTATLSGYEVTTTVTNQKDIIFAYNGENRKFDDKGNISEVKAGLARTTEKNDINIHFYHALSAIKFDVSGVSDELYVSDVTLNNIYSKGDCDITVDGDGKLDFDWDASDLEAPANYAQSFGATGDFGSDGKMVDGSNKLFFLIPQSLEADGVKDAASLTVSFKNVSDGSANATKTVNIDLNDGAAVTWEAGKYYTYRFSKSADDFSYTLSIEKNWDYFDDNAFDDVTRGYTVTSKKIDNKTSDVVDANYPWHIKSYRIGSGPEVPVNASSFDVSTLWLSSTVKLTDKKLSVTAQPAPFTDKGCNEYWTGGNGDWSPSSWEGTTTDLSKLDFRTDTRDDHEMTTANCYVIRHAGTYKLPLVYGNAVLDGVPNSQAYAPGVTGGDNRLETFVNHKDQPILSPFIENHTGCDNPKCAIIWQTGTGVLSDIEIVGDRKTNSTTTDPYTLSDVRYLQFEVNQDNICQSNALVCIYDDLDGDDSYDEGECIWSWHIWTFNDPVLLEDPIAVTNYDGDKTYYFFPTYNMGTIETIVYEDVDPITITIAQDSPADSSPVKITLEQDIFVPEINGVSYNWGRKDPFSHEESLVVKDSRGPVTVGTSISNPCTFFYSSSGAINWCSGQYMNLWTGKKCIEGDFAQDDDVIKTIYDPSPVGYKVPVIDAFSSFTNDEEPRSPDKSHWNVVSTEHNFSGYAFYTSLGPGKTVNTGGPTISFPFNGMRIGASYAGKLEYKYDRGWYYSVNVEYTPSTGSGLRPYMLQVEQDNVCKHNIASPGNGHCVRPVVDTTVPAPPPSY